MDDFNMPVKDQFGSQPPLELIRMWLDYGFWYDREKQVHKEIRVGFSFFSYFSGAVMVVIVW
jgi:dynein heavy chain